MTHNDHRWVWGLLLDDELNIYNRRGGIIGVYETEKDAEEMIEHIKANPYFNGKLSVVPFKVGHDYSAWSEWQKARKDKKK